MYQCKTNIINDITRNNGTHFRCGLFLTVEEMGANITDSCCIDGVVYFRHMQRSARDMYLL